MTDAISRLAEALAERYRIDRRIGSGGMATVYLAHDLRHDRPVALKVLRPELAAVIGAERFLAEIRTTANLQHPNILSLFDSGQVDGTAFYVMPYVDGESLRDRLERETQLPVGEAIAVTREMAEALHYAHGHGVIHRDIKPENVLLQNGHALISDFGIALAVSHTGGRRLTETGMSLGTPAYMSPEQAMGDRALDARTDIYALGCVLYEMLAGEPPFTGPTPQAIVARVMTEEPRPLAGQRRTVPAAVDRAVIKALAKLPADRFSSAAEFGAALAVPADLERSLRRERKGLVPLLGASLLIATVVGAWGWLRARESPPVTRSFLGFPASEAPRLDSPVELLPDGSGLLYIGPGEGGSQVWLKRRSELHAIQIPGTAGAVAAFPSPDGQWIGFVTDGQLAKVPIGGGPRTTIATGSCNSLACVGARQVGTWLEDGRIVTIVRDAMILVREGSEEADSLVTSSAIGGFAPVMPSAVPGSRGLLFTRCALYCNSSDVMVIDLESRKITKLVENGTSGRYLASGHLFYLDGRGAGMVVPFDRRTLEVRGPATQVLDRVAGNVTVARNGTLVYLEGDHRPGAELVLIDRTGAATPVDSGWRANFGSLAISPDGRRLVAVIATDGEEHLYLKTLGGGPATRLTFGKQVNTTPSWSADGSRIYFTRFIGDSSVFLAIRADGTGGETVVQAGANWVIESVASRDGRWLVTREYRAGARDIYARRIDSAHGSEERLLASTPLNEFSPTVSADGSMLAHIVADGDGRSLWVSRFPDTDQGRWQVIPERVSEPLWSPVGNELFYIDDERRLASITLSLPGGFASSRPRHFFPVVGFRRHRSHRAYDVLPDGRFVMIRDVPRAEENLVLVDRWSAEVAARLAR